MILSGESGGLVNAIGAYKGPIVPSLGAVTFNPTNSSDSIGIGTSVFTAGSPNSGFQLIPEPSAALLGALGALGLLRRRRA
jgi:MYXO-CTERM domain-containing protein